jgi:chromosomal replication initiator protein
MRHVALSICSGVPDLEGALVPVHAYASLTDTPITLSMAQSVLKSLIDLVEPRTSIEEIQRAVCREFGLDLPQLKSKSVSRRFSYPRQIATYVAKELPPPPHRCRKLAGSSGEITIPRCCIRSTRSQSCTRLTAT